MSAPSPLLAIPESRLERWNILSRVIADWYPESNPNGGISEDAIVTNATRLGIPIPAAIREWYTRFGARSDVWSQQDELLMPDRMHVTSGHLTFLVENQAVVEWGIATENLFYDDPPVHASSVDDQDTWLLDSATTSMFALQRFAYCLKFSRSIRWFANAYVTRTVSSIVMDGYPELLSIDSTWPGPTKFFGDRDTMIELEGVADASSSWLYAVTRTAAAAVRFKNLLNKVSIKWNATSDEWPDGWVNLSHDMP